MKKLVLVICLAASSANADTLPGMKPGLWEVKPISQVIDGRDTLAAMQASRAKMQESFAKLPPERRKAMEDQMGLGYVTVCIDSSVANQAFPMIDPKSHCQPEKVRRSGDHTSFEFHCVTSERTMDGTGESTVNGDTVHNRMEMTYSDAKGTHHMLNEGEMTYVSADCSSRKSGGMTVTK